MKIRITHHAKKKQKGMNNMEENKYKRSLNIINKAILIGFYLL